MQDFSIDSYLHLARDKGKVENDSMRLILEGKVPSVPLLTALDMLPYLLNIESQGLNLLHLK